MLEYCDGGDLEAYRQTHGGPRNRLPEAIARDFARQLGEFPIESSVPFPLFITVLGLYMF